MKKAVVGILAMFGLLSILAVFAFAGVALIATLSQPGVPHSVILELDLSKGLVEVIPDDPVAQYLLEGELQLRDVVDALDRGAADHRVKGLVARIGGKMGLAHIQEIRDAVARFRASGKPALAYAESFGEFSAGNGAYYLATAFDEIYLQPGGDVGLTGLMYESMFIRGTLNKLDVTPRVEGRYEYKNAANYYTEESFTPAHREALETVMNSQFDQMLKGMSDARGIPVEELRAMCDRGPYLADEALSSGLVDGLSFRDEVYDDLRSRIGGSPSFLFLPAYLDRAGRPNTRGETVALIHGYGTILQGPSSFSPLDGTVIMGSDTVTHAFRQAIRDDRVKAIVFRVDSPGGSPVASEAIWRQTVLGQELKKPVIVTMGNLAGSGGYMVAMGATKIVAEPGTITGSIGVLGGKLLTRGFWSKLGVTYDDVQTSANGSMWSTHHDYDAAERERFEALLDRIYDDFTQKVAEGRGLPIEDVLKIARGRIWTGADAKELGLVDELGGYETALRLVREELGLAADAPLRIKRFPPQRSTLDLIFGRHPDSSERLAQAALHRTLKVLQPQVRLLQRLGLAEQPPVSLLMPEAAP